MRCPDRAYLLSLSLSMVEGFSSTLPLEGEGVKKNLKGISLDPNS
jgi:hypothetical protein